MPKLNKKTKIYLTIFILLLVIYIILKNNITPEEIIVIPIAIIFIPIAVVLSFSPFIAIFLIIKTVKKNLALKKQMLETQQQILQELKGKGKAE